jgi:hypothetical protein
MIKINDQEQVWDKAFCPKRPRIGSLVAIRFGADGPGIDSFRRFISRENLDYVFVRCGLRKYSPLSKWDVFCIVESDCCRQ